MYCTITENNSPCFLQVSLSLICHGFIHVSRCKRTCRHVQTEPGVYFCRCGCCVQQTRGILSCPFRCSGSKQSSPVCNTAPATQEFMGFASGFLPVLVIKSQTWDLMSNPVTGRFSIHENKFLNRRRPLPNRGFLLCLCPCSMAIASCHNYKLIGREEVATARKGASGKALVRISRGCPANSHPS